MKQTNNAIKFLMAQYRAIFRNANLKMFLAAATAAAAMAAGSAQAAAPTVGWDQIKEGSGDSITTDTEFTSAEETVTNANAFTLTINGTGKTVSFASTKDPNGTTYNAENASIVLKDGTLEVGKDTSKAVNLKVSSFTATGGALKIGVQGDAAALQAGSINLGGEGSKEVVTTLGAKGTLGADKSVIVVGDKATINADAAVAGVAASKIVGTSLTLNSGAKLTVADSKGISVNTGSLTVNTGAAVSNGTGSTIALGGSSATFAKGTLTNKGTIDLGTLKKGRAEYALTVDADDFNKNLFKDAAKIQVTGAAGDDNLANLYINVTGTETVDLVTSGLIKAGDGSVLDTALSGATATKVDVHVSGGTATLAADTYKAGDKFKSVELAFDSLTVGNTDKEFTVDSAQSVVSVHNALKHAKEAAQGIAVVSGGTLNLFATGANAGDVVAKGLTVGADAGDGGKLQVQGTWSLPSLTIKSGTALLNDATVTLKENAVLTTKDNTNKLTLANSTLDVTAGKVQLVGESGAALNTGSKLTINADQLYKDSELTNATDGNKVVAKALETDGSGILEINNAGEVTDEVLKTIDKLGYKGFIQFGEGSTVNPSEDKTVNFTDTNKNLGIAGVYNNATVVMDGANNNINKNVAAGSIKLNKQDDTGVIDANGVILSNAAVNGGYFISNNAGDAAGNVKLGNAASSLTLNGAGKIGSIDAGADGQGQLLIGSAAYGNTSAVELTGDIGKEHPIKNIDMTNGSLTVDLAKDAKTGVIKTNALSVGEGSSIVAKSHDITVGAGTGTTSTVATIKGDIDAQSLTFAGEGTHSILGGANITVESLAGTKKGSINVGQDGVENGSATVKTTKLALNGGTLNIDPAYNQHYASTITMNLNGTNGNELDGLVNVGANSLFAVGFDTVEDVEAALGQLLVTDKDGTHFTDPAAPLPTADTDSTPVAAPKAQNAVVLNKHISINNTTGGGLYVGTGSTKASANSLTIDNGGALVVTDEAFGRDAAGNKTGSAITLDSAATVTIGNGNGGAKPVVVLAGAFTGADDGLKLTDGKVLSKTELDKLDLRMGTDLLVVNAQADGSFNIDLTADKAVLGAAFTDSAAPVRDVLIDILDGTELKPNQEAGYQFLAEVTRDKNHSGAKADAAAHAATYAGAQVAAVAAVGTMAEAVGGRVGSMGVEATAITATGSQANGGVWLSPMYKSVDADGFNAQGGSYGADVDLTGVAFGADTVNGNMRFGAVFNIGSGDADGKGNGNGLKDEFDYYGFGMYTVMGFGNLALVGDASLNVISHDVEGLGAKGSADTTAVTMGVTGQYTISNPMVDVTPHLGARFIRLDTDSYDLVADGETLATTDFEVQNVFSIPLGVTLSKAFEMGGWSLAPSADLSVTFNTGDTEVDSTTRFTGVNRNLGLNTEVLDEVTYGVAVGLGAQYGAFGTQIGLNYTGSENTDSFGVNAQARYMF